MVNAFTPECIPCNATRILITDDEPLLCDIFRISLSHFFSHCACDVASNGAEAVESFKQFHHSILLMDIEMPVMNGLATFDSVSELCAKKRWDMPAVIFCSGCELAPSIKMRVEKGPRHGFIQKPVSLSIIRAAVKARLPAAS